jgi:hypothetical protein
MASMTAFAGEQIERDDQLEAAKTALYKSIHSLSDWLVRNNYRGYDTFDGLNARFVRPFTFETRLLRTVLQQGVRRFPVNTRALLGVKKECSSKGMGFLARGFIRLYASTGDRTWRHKAEYALNWLEDHQSKGYSGACWGNHFDYQSRTFFLPQGTPTVVWTSLIGHAFLDGYDQFKNEQHLQIAISACEHILRDLDRYPDGAGTCISYVPGMNSQVHNANTLGGSLLARTYAHTHNEEYKALAQASIQYTAQHQQPNGAWWYGEKSNLHWVDNFHTAYVLDCFKHYAENTGDHQFDQNMMHGYEYWKSNFFMEDGAPKYYNHKVLPLDIQCCSQAIDTLVFFSDYDPEALPLAVKVAQWTIDNMQDPSGYFYYRRYSARLVNKTPTLHWGQATMLSALSGLYKRLSSEENFA